MITMNRRSGGEASSIAWTWVMESLAEVKEIDTADIDNLLKIVPDGYNLLGPSAKERLALRRLGDMFATTSNADTTNLKSTSGSSVIDVTERAQDVYNRILNKMETSDVLGSSNLDIHQFVTQKRGQLPKCGLQQIEEAFTERGQSSSEIMREVCVGLAKRKYHLNNATKIQTSNVNITCPVSENQDVHLQEDLHAGPSNITRKDEGEVQFLEKNAPTHSVCDASNSSVQCNKIGEFQPVNEILSGKRKDHLNNGIEIQTPNVNITCPVSENHDEHMQEDLHSEPSNIASNDEGEAQFLEKSARTHSVHDAISRSVQCNGIGEFQPVNELSSASGPENMNDAMQVDQAIDVRVSGKRKRSDLSNEMLVDYMDNDKQEYVEHSSDPMHVCEALQSPHGNILSSVRNEATSLAKGAQVNDLEDDAICTDDGIDDSVRVSKRIKCPANSLQTDHQEGRVEGSNDHDKNQTPGKVQEANDKHAKNQASSMYSQEEIAAMKSSLLNSQMIMTQDSPEAEWTEENTCVKCNKSGQLLVCCVETCPIIVHESCLGSSACFDSTGQFHCPLCSYTQALTAYRVAKEKASRAKKKAELLSNCLHEFMNLKQDQKKQKQKDTEIPIEPGNNHANGKTLENLVLNAHPDGEVPENQVSLSCPPVDATLESLHRPPDNAPPESLDCLPVNAPPESLERSQINARPESVRPPVNATRDGEVMENRESLNRPPVSAPRESNVNAGVYCDSVSGQEPVNITKEPLFQLNANAPGPSNASGPCPSKGPCPPLVEIIDSHGAGTKTATDHELADGGVENANEPRRFVLIDKEVAEVGTTNRDLQREAGPSSRGPLPSFDQIAEDVSAQDSGARGFIFRKRQGRPPPKINQVTTRRVKTKWTAAEVDALTEGMKRFGNSATPWKLIMEFGKDVFNPCRVTGDLKDKWRNMRGT